MSRKRSRKAPERARGDLSVDSIASPASVCVSCSASVTGRYCSHCGELRADLRHDGLAHVGAELFEALTHVDGKILRSLRALLTRPGELTAAYLRGARKPYMGPVQVFLIANVVYFAMHSWRGWNALSTPLHTHLQAMPYQSFARAHALSFAAAHGLDLHVPEQFDILAKAFNALAPVYAKSLVFVWVPLYALGVALVRARRRIGALGALVFSAHVMSAFLWVWGLVILPFGERIPDVAGSAALLGALGVYQFFALKRAFGITNAGAVWRSIALVAVFSVVLFAYRLMLFLVVLHTLHLPKS